MKSKLRDLSELIKKPLREAYKLLIYCMGRNGLGLGGSSPSCVGNWIWIKKLEDFITSNIKPEFLIHKGKIIYLDKADSYKFSYHGFDKEPDQKIIYEKYIKEGDVVIDVGAFIGDNTIDFADYVGKTGKVYAFELAKDNYDLLVKNIKANGYENTICYNKGVADKKGKVKCFLNPVNSMGNKMHKEGNIDKYIDSWEEVDVESVALDDVIKCKVDFIKIDVEGSEPLVINGAMKILRENPNLKIMLEFRLVTIPSFGYTPKKYLEMFADLGFRMYIAEESSKKDTEIKDINKFLEEVEKDVIINLFMIKGEK
ncbi:MAG: FkbM family methyltransferase [Nanoarchaeota archaeon]|nr:FkbM family methyltransferase [Nanoarchaeota archaeon]